jgi:hypothetical protein
MSSEFFSIEEPARFALIRFLGEAGECLADFNGTRLHTALEQEYALACPPVVTSPEAACQVKPEGQQAEPMPSAASIAPKTSEERSPSRIGDRGHPVHITNFDDLVMKLRGSTGEISALDLYRPASELATITGLSLPEIHRLCKDKKTRSRKPSANRLQVHVLDLLDYIRNRPTSGESPRST